MDSAYDIVKLHKYDDVDLMPKWKKTLFRFAPITTFGAVGSYIVYFAFRIYCTKDSQDTFHKTYWLAWFFIVAEALVACRLHSTYSNINTANDTQYLPYSTKPG